jgi:hypothetical protein
MRGTFLFEKTGCLLVNVEEAEPRSTHIVAPFERLKLQ